MIFQTGEATPTAGFPQGKPHLTTNSPLPLDTLTAGWPQAYILRAPRPGGREYSLHACRTNTAVKDPVMY